MGLKPTSVDEGTVEKSNQWLTLPTNFGVIAGLGLLVYEISQNTQALNNDINVAIYSMAADNGRLLIESRELRDVLERATTEEWSESPLRKEQYCGVTGEMKLIEWSYNLSWLITQNPTTSCLPRQICS